MPYIFLFNVIKIILLSKMAFKKEIIGNLIP